MMNSFEQWARRASASKRCETRGEARCGSTLRTSGIDGRSECSALGRTARSARRTTVASFDGAYFAVVSSNIERALSAAQPFPQTTVQFRAALQAAGIDFDSLRDP